MTDEQKTDTEQPEKRPERDEQGHFLPGNTIGDGHGFPPGVSGNPGGRPKTKSLTDALLVHLDKKASEFHFTKKAAKNLGMDADKATVLEVMMATFILNGMKGKGDISREMWARIEGAIPKHVTLAADDPVTVYLQHMEDATAPPPPSPDAPADDGVGAAPTAPDPESDAPREDVNAAPQ